MQGMKMRIVPPQVEDVLKTALGIRTEDWRSKTVTVLDTEVSPVSLLELANPAHLKAFEHKAVQVDAILHWTVRNNPCQLLMPTACRTNNSYCNKKCFVLQ